MPFSFVLSGYLFVWLLLARSLTVLVLYFPCADGEELLSQVHERLITVHTSELKAAGLYEQAAARSVYRSATRPTTASGRRLRAAAAGS